MATRRINTQQDEGPRQAPATSPHIREQQLIGLAYDLVERKMRDGTASSQETSLFLKLGSSREYLEQERMRHEIELMEVKREAMESAQKVEQLYAEAMAAFSSYSGNPQLEPGEDDDDY